MSERVDALADVLNSLGEWNRTRDAAGDQQLASLRLIVEQMATAMALQEVQIAQLREAVLLLASRRE